MARNASQNSLRVNTVAQAAPLIASYGLNVIATPIMVAELGLASFGVWALTGAVAQYGALFDFGITRSVTRFVALHHARGHTRGEHETLTVALASLLALGLILVPATWLISVPLQKIFDGISTRELRILLACSAIILVFGLLSRCVASLAFGRGRMVSLNMFLAGGNSMPVVSGVGALLWLNGGLQSFAIASAAGALGGLVLVISGLLLFERPIRIAFPPLSLVRELLSFGIRGQSVLVADLLVFQSSKIVIGVVLGPAATGAYELASRIALGGRAFGTLPSNAATPVLTRDYALGGLDKIRTDFGLIAFKTARAGVAVPFAVAALAPAFMPLWLGDVPPQVTPLCIALSLIFTINIATGTATVAALAAGRASVVAKSATATAIVNSTLVVPLIFFLGSWGAIASIGLATTFGAIYGVRLVDNQIGLDHLVHWKAIAQPLVVGLAVFSVACSFCASVPSEPKSLAVASCLIGGSGFAAGYLFFTRRRTRMGRRAQ